MNATHVPTDKRLSIAGGREGLSIRGHVIIISSSVSLHIISKDQESQDCFDFDLLAAPKKMITLICSLWEDDPLS